MGTSHQDRCATRFMLIGTPDPVHAARAPRTRRRASRLVAALLALAAPAAGDSIVLNNGNQLEGTILAEEGDSVKIKLPYGTIDLRRRDIREIRRTAAVDTLLYLGEQLLYHGDFERAIDELVAARRADPASDRARAKLTAARRAYASFLESVYRYDDAIAVLRAVEEGDGAAAEARERIAAIEAVKAAFDGRLREAQARLADDRIEEARNRLLELWEIYPERRAAVGPPLAYAEVALGDRASRLASFKEATEHYERALTYHPDRFPQIIDRYTNALARVAEDLLERRDLESAERLLSRALSHAPEDEFLHYMLGRTFEAQGKIPEALLHFDRICPDPSRPFDPAGAKARSEERARAETVRAPAAPARSGPPVTVRTRHFAVAAPDQALGGRVAEALEHHFSTLGPAFGVTAFERHCEVTVHASKERFLQVSKAEAWAPAYASWEFKLGHLVSLEIHTYQDCPQLLASALPHELAHLLLAARLGFRRDIPLWATEGLAVYHEPPFKQRYYRRALSLAVVQRRLIPLARLLEATAYPPREELDLFYGQSLSLAAYLIKRRGFKRFLAFLDDLSAAKDSRNIVHSWDVWKRCYGFSSASNMDNIWRKYGIE